MTYQTVGGGLTILASLLLVLGAIFWPVLLLAIASVRTYARKHKILWLVGVYLGYMGMALAAALVYDILNPLKQLAIGGLVVGGITLFASSSAQLAKWAGKGLNLFVLMAFAILAVIAATLTAQAVLSYFGIDFPEFLRWPVIVALALSNGYSLATGLLPPFIVIFVLWLTMVIIDPEKDRETV